MTAPLKNKKVAAGIGVAAVAAAALALGAGTYASFTDREVAPDATFTAGSLDLVIGDTGEVFSASNIAPGYTSETRTLRFLNNGTLPGKLAFTFAATNQENDCNEPEREVDTTCTGTAGELGSALVVAIEGPGLSYTGPISTIPAVNNAVVPPGTRTGATYKVIFSLPQGVGNEVQSDSVVITSTATLTQQ